MKYLVIKYLICSFAFILVFLFSPLVFAQTPPGTITVIGMGTASSVANRASLKLTVSAQDQTATGLFVKENDIVSRLKKAFIDAGVEGQDIMTEQYKLLPNYEYGQQGTRVISYRMDTPLTVEVDDVSSVPHLIDLATASGASSISIGSMSSTSGNEVNLSATKNALADARRRAQALAQAVGKTVGDVISVSEDEEKPLARSGGESEEDRERKQPADTQNTLLAHSQVKVVFQLK